ncbi:MAG: hypothetical protein IMZ53_09580 [Thermoplasmata archaeon]|nr:hypothetical protein [Thermoplasmata archaeon]
MIKKLLTMIILLACGWAWGSWTADTVKRHEVTWYFSSNKTVDTFPNGDPWVLSPVTIDSIHPTYSNGKNGWMVDPIYDGDQSFCDSCKGVEYDVALQPSLPYTYSGDTIVSVCKSIWNTGNFNRCLSTVEVLTVCSNAPPGNGSTVFRPPYCGTEKTWYYLSDIQLDSLPAVASFGTALTFDSIHNKFERLWMYLKDGAIGRAMRPTLTMEGHSPANCADQTGAIVRFLTSDTAGIMPALINYLQNGIDKMHTVYLGQQFVGGDGHEAGHQVVCSFTAVMLNNARMKTELDTATYFHANRFFRLGDNGKLFWGNPTSTEALYWGYIMTGGGSRSESDPYGMIDGSTLNAVTYQVITSQSHKGEILCAGLMPSLLTAWRDTFYYTMENYVDRWTNIGVWSLPDPYAPYDGIPGNYGITFGPDGGDDGIKGSGRYVTYHSSHRNGGQYHVAFIDSMWTHHRPSFFDATNDTPMVSLNYDIDGDTITDSISFSFTTYAIHGIDSIYYTVGSDKNTISSSSACVYNVKYETPEYGENNIVISVVDDESNKTSVSFSVFKDGGEDIPSKIGKAWIK